MFNNLMKFSSAKLKGFMEKRGLNQTTLADASGISREYTNKAIKGKNLLVILYLYFL